jgi:hypothetical protein
MAYDDPRAVSPEDALTMDEWRRRIMGGKPPLLTEQSGGLDTILAGIQRIPGRIAEDTPKFLAGLQRLYSDPSSIMETPTAQMIQSGGTLARDVAEGKIDPRSDEGIQRALDMANLASLGSVTATAPEGALAAGAARRRRGVPMTAEEISAAAARAQTPQPSTVSTSGVADAADRAAARIAERDAVPPPVDPDRYKYALPQYADRYPQAGEFELKPREKGRRKGELYEAKSQSAEERELMKNRALIVKEMEEKPWSPYFDVKKRQDVDPSNYPREFDTLEVTLLKKQRDRDRHTTIANEASATARLKQAYEHGQRLGGGGNWYFVKQLEDEFIKVYGPEEGRKQFQQKFAGAMAATTAGMSPTNNLLAAHYGNFLRNHDLPFPEKSYDIPSPLGGPYTKSNLDEYAKTFVGPDAPMKTKSAVDNPKRYDFEHDFLGYRNPVVDKQMSQLFNPKYEQPTNYGAFGRRLVELAERYGVDPRYFQEVAWGGAKNMKTRTNDLRDPSILWNSRDYGGGFKPKPMMQIINEAIERTSRLTGRSPEDVLVESIIKSNKPLYQKGVPLPAGEREEERR